MRLFLDLLRLLRERFLPRDLRREEDRLRDRRFLPRDLRRLLRPRDLRIDLESFLGTHPRDLDRLHRAERRQAALPRLPITLHALARLLYESFLETAITDSEYIIVIEIFLRFYEMMHPAFALFPELSYGSAAEDNRNKSAELFIIGCFSFCGRGFETEDTEHLSYISILMGP